MVSLTVLFWMFVVLFATIGGIRGWAKEIMVTFSAILAMFLIVVMETYVGLIRNTIVKNGGETLFWFRATILVFLVFFGYLSPNFKAFAGSGRFARDRLQDVLLGIFLGAINGYLIVGTMWWWMNVARYPFPTIVAPPKPNSGLLDASGWLLPLMPPTWLMDIPLIYFAVGVAFVFVVIVFL